MGIRPLNDEELEKLLDIDFSITYSGHVFEYQEIAKAQFKQDIKNFIEWAYGECPHGSEGMKMDCGQCWLDFKQLVEEEWKTKMQ